jgi:oxygen-independent coproporphyrinogen III oxidase
MYCYIHIPFCRKRCHYCKFALTTQFNQASIQRYLIAVAEEIEARLPKSKPIESIYFWGGTPSILSARQLHFLLWKFTNRTRNVEICLEINPEDSTEDFAYELRECGFNRISVGVQTLESASLELIGRSPKDTIFQALDHLQKAGHSNIWIDTILWLPQVPFWGTLKTLKTLLNQYTIQHASVYFLEKGEYPKKWNALTIETEAIRSEYSAIRSLLAEHSMEQYEISNFWTSGHASQHNLAYWNNKDCMGFGLSASSSIWYERRINAMNFPEYYSGKYESEQITLESYHLETALCQFRTFQLEQKYIQSSLRLQQFLQEGLVEWRGERIAPTETWIFLIDYIMSELL